MVGNTERLQYNSRALGTVGECGLGLDSDDVIYDWWRMGYGGTICALS